MCQGVSDGDTDEGLLGDGTNEPPVYGNTEIQISISDTGRKEIKRQSRLMVFLSNEDGELVVIFISKLPIPQDLISVSAEDTRGES